MFDNHSPHTRGPSIARVLARCSPPPRPRWFVVNLRDVPQAKATKLGLPLFGSSRAAGRLDIAAPDYVFGGWLEIGDRDFDRTCADLTHVGSSPASTGLLGWYGAASRHPNRNVLVELGRRYPNRMEIVDVEYFGEPGTPPDPSVGMNMEAQVARFRYLIDIEGIGYSGRLKYLLHSGRPILIQTRPWQEWFFPQLIAWKHYVPVKRDLSDLLGVLDRLDADPNLGARIASDALAFACRNLTLGSAVAKWSALLSGEDEFSPWRKDSRRARLTAGRGEAN
jgi:hypothetical protein